MSPSSTQSSKFSSYQKLVVGLLAFLQFSIILDFMIIAPLGALIMPAMVITTKQFSMIVSAYAFSAGLSGLLVAGFADRYDRKKLLLFFYTGFVLSTLWCGLAQTFPMLLLARIVTGIFGGVIGSIVLAIATDLFAVQLRGRVMGLIQTAFGASQILGLPVGLYLSSRWNWHAPFLVMVIFGLAGGLVMLFKLRPIVDHLAAPPERSAFHHLLSTIKDPRYLSAFATTALLTTGGFMLMPFSSAFTVNNIGIKIEHLPTIYFLTGIFTIFVGPLVGKAADAFGKLPVFILGSFVTVVMVLIYTHLGNVPLTTVILVNVLMFTGIFSRLIPFQALVSSVPEQTKRGSFNAVSASIQQFSGGIASVIAGHIVSFGTDGKLQHFPVVGYVMIVTVMISAVLVLRIQQELSQRAIANA
ncbi:MFS transporter [Methyloradius palustris]|uniref:MFS transporter n=1 Tax=Methyloradius palustris TaxID=2778876 RepID=A0A8D5JVP0_9PROT|nr:MFS transporter [Methyloradius palustris]BCM24314.1 MFS transporter [Methyloradius palustris]